MTADRRAPGQIAWDQATKELKDIEQMADRAALVEKVARAICKADGTEPDSLDPWMGEYQHPAWEDYEDHATAAIDLIRANVLEEAASVADEKEDDWDTEWRDGAKCSSHLEGKSDGAHEVAAAIRALKGDT